MTEITTIVLKSSADLTDHNNYNCKKSSLLITRHVGLFDDGLLLFQIFARKLFCESLHSVQTDVCYITRFL